MDPPGEHIPTWLPAFPDPTYASSYTRIERTTEPPTAKINQENQYRKEERSFLNLHQWLACNGLEGTSLVKLQGCCKGKTSMSEALAADIEVMNSRLLVSEGHKMVILKIRPIVQFKMGVGML
ncbi:hypothetical protein I3842_03G083900 [Carya illinoinensis]|uniref:Transcription initiation factor TFIID subunit 8 n=1 Tax=Carya illinoinensis TaxID=32201 RepID=A0A922FJL3_CARIL|nr:hypothetical protein I3842_03G083900 [Carya illinoinensis]